jgi:hypothetical protein
MQAVGSFEISVNIYQISRRNIRVPNVVVKWLTLMLHIRELPDSNPGPDTGYPDWGFSWFFSVPPGECPDSTLKFGHDRLLPDPFQFTIYLSPHHSPLYSLIYDNQTGEGRTNLRWFCSTFDICDDKNRKLNVVRLGRQVDI